MARYETRSESVRYRLGSTLVGACLFQPTLRKPQPALLYLHDRQGLDLQALGIAERYAHVGYLTLAVDLYVGEAPTAPAELAALADQLDAHAVEAHLWTALAWLRTHPHVKRDRVGAIGVGMGGALAFSLAASDAHVQAAIACDGDAQEAAVFAASVRAPVMGLFAGPIADSAAPVERLRRAIEATGVPHALTVYAGTQRGFFNERSATFNFDCAEDAWSRSNKFFYQFLGEPSDA